jgi:hypothetical protein
MKTRLLLLIIPLVLTAKGLHAQCSRASVINDYNNVYLQTGVSDVQLAWSGNYGSCLAGTISTLAQHNTLARINYFRRLAGVAEITFDPAISIKCQQAALMMGANGQISRNPPPTWLCYTSDGASAALYALLASGFHSASAISMYIDDSNTDYVGHRRLVLYSRGSVYGHGATPTVDVLQTVNTPLGPVDTRNIAYPSAGFFPAPLIPAKWSFGKSNADFSGATVEMTGPSGAPVSLTVAANVNGYGDNTIVWAPLNIITNSTYDVTYTVKIGNVMVSGVPQNYTYNVTVCQPVHPPQCPAGQTWSETDCSCTTATGIGDIESDLLSVLITNPFTEVLRVRILNISFKDSELSVMDMTGKEVEKRTICSESEKDYTLTIDTSGWKRGIYFVILKNGTGNKIVRKVIKQ